MDNNGMILLLSGDREFCEYNLFKCQASSCFNRLHSEKSRSPLKNNIGLKFLHNFVGRLSSNVMGPKSAATG